MEYDTPLDAILSGAAMKAARDHLKLHHVKGIIGSAVLMNSKELATNIQQIMKMKIPDYYMKINPKSKMVTDMKLQGFKEIAPYERIEHDGFD